ncbi:hypothetical protein BD408DRAFT_409613 [Parasitella parasitica]|nr:hypothetical protein BD408DRAFT_409613 [Parasitella parasitica]
MQKTVMKSSLCRGILTATSFMQSLQWLVSPDVHFFAYYKQNESLKSLETRPTILPKHCFIILGHFGD